MDGMVVHDIIIAQLCTASGTVEPVEAVGSCRMIFSQVDELENMRKDINEEIDRLCGCIEILLPPFPTSCC